MCAILVETHVRRGQRAGFPDPRLGLPRPEAGDRISPAGSSYARYCCPPRLIMITDHVDMTPLVYYVSYASPSYILRSICTYSTQ